MRLTEGDIFRWHWKQYNDFNRWCTSPYCEVRRGKLLDIYWGFGEVSFRDRKVLDPDKVELTYLGNINDYEPVHSIENYDKTDVLNLTHSNCYSGLLFKKKGAKRSLEVTKDNLLKEIIECQKERGYLDGRIQKRMEEYEDLCLNGRESTYFYD